MTSAKSLPATQLTCRVAANDQRSRFENAGEKAGFAVAGYGAGLSVAPFGFGRLSISWERQATRDSLPQSEQWVLGGFDRLSAWLPGVAVGDRGSVAQLAYRFPVRHESEQDLRVGITLERGTAEFVGQPSAQRSTLSSVGLGLSLRFAGNWVIEARSGLPLQQHAPAGLAIDDEESAFYVRAARAFDTR